MDKMISFGAPMMRAMASGLKTQTRRLMNRSALAVRLRETAKQVPARIDPEGSVWAQIGSEWAKMASDEFDLLCPYAEGVTHEKDGSLCIDPEPDARLRVKEDVWLWLKKIPNGKSSVGRPRYRYLTQGQHVVYRADSEQKPPALPSDDPALDWRLRPARFMPHWASRRTLLLKSIRLEPLHCITEADALAEGLPVFGLTPIDALAGLAQLYPDIVAWIPDIARTHPHFARLHPADKKDKNDASHVADCQWRFVYALLWQHLHRLDRYGAWVENPWVWTIDYSVNE